MEYILFIWNTLWNKNFLETSWFAEHSREIARDNFCFLSFHQRTTPNPYESRWTCNVNEKLTEDSLNFNELQKIEKNEWFLCDSENFDLGIFWTFNLVLKLNFLFFFSMVKWKILLFFEKLKKVKMTVIGWWDKISNSLWWFFIWFFRKRTAFWFIKRFMALTSDVFCWRSEVLSFNGNWLLRNCGMARIWKENFSFYCKFCIRNSVAKLIELNESN